MTTIAYVMTETWDDGSDSPTPVFVSMSKLALLDVLRGYVESCVTGDGDYPENAGEAAAVSSRIVSELVPLAWTPSLHHEVQVPELGRSLLFNAAMVV
jgi:hypothetical protein